MPVWDVRFDLRIDLEAPRLAGAVARAETLARLNKSLPMPPDVRERLDRLYINRAVRGTTGIEGAEVTEEEVALILDADPSQRILPRARAREEQEVRNAAQVMAYISSTLEREPAAPLTEGMIAKIHELTTQGIEYEHNIPGAYRSHAVSAGTYVPPRSHGEVVALMGGFIDWLKVGARSLPPVVRAVAAHFYFVSIHPFGDGNGRAARAIESYLLYQSSTNVLGFYSLANYYYQHRDAYIEGLDFARFRSGGDLTPFITFALNGLIDELEEMHQEILRSTSITVFRDFADRELRRTGKLVTKAGERLRALLAGLEDPVAIQAILDGTHSLGRLYWRLNPKTLRRDIDYLRKLHLVVVNERRVQINVELMHRRPARPQDPRKD